jgi:hypothetical protein
MSKNQYRSNVKLAGAGGVTIKLQFKDPPPAGNSWVIWSDNGEVCTPDELVNLFFPGGEDQKESSCDSNGVFLVPNSWHPCNRKDLPKDLPKKKKAARASVSAVEDPLRAPTRTKPKAPSTPRPKKPIPPSQIRTNGSGAIVGYCARKANFDPELRFYLAGAADMAYKMNKTDVQKRLMGGKVPMIGPLMALAVGDGDAIAWGYFQVCTFDARYSGKKIFAIRGTEKQQLKHNVITDHSLFRGGKGMKLFLVELAKVETALKDLLDAGHQVDYIVGHSLGGTCCEILAMRYGIPGMSFAAPGPFSDLETYNLIAKETNTDFDFEAVTSEDDFVCRQPRGKLLQKNGFKLANDMHIVKKVTKVSVGGHGMDNYCIAVGCPGFLEAHQEEFPQRARSGARSGPPPPPATRARASAFGSTDAIAVTFRTREQLLADLTEGDDGGGLFGDDAALREEAINEAAFDLHEDETVEEVGRKPKTAAKRGSTAGKKTTKAKTEMIPQEEEANVKKAKKKKKASVKKAN